MEKVCFVFVRTQKKDDRSKCKWTKTDDGWEENKW